MILVLSHLLDLLLVILLLAIGLGLGLALLARGGLKPPDPLAALGFGITVGLGILGTGFLVLGALGWLSIWSLGALTLGATVVGGKELLRIPSLLAEIPGFMATERGSGISLAWGLLVLGSVAAFLLAFGAAPPVDWDTLMYHLPIPAQFLEEGRIFLPPDNLHVSFVGLLHMLYLPFLAVGSTAAAALLNGALACLMGLVLFSMGARFFRGEAGSVSLGLVWGTTTLLLVAITPRTDVSLALFLLVAHYAFLLALDEDQPPGWAYLGAVLVGFAAGIKFNGLAYGAALAPLALWVAWKRGGRKGAAVEGEGRVGSGVGGPGGGQVGGAVKTAVLLGALGLVVLSPWLLKNWALLGAPFYPYFADRTVEPWLQALYQANPGVQGPDPALSQALRGLRSPVSLWGVFFAPGSLTAETEGAFYFTNRIFLLLPLGIFFLGRKRLGWLTLPPLLYLALILIPFPSTNLRYLLPAVPALTLAVAFALIELGKRYVPGGWGSVGILVLATWMLMPTGRAMKRWMEGTEAGTHLLGSTSEAEFWANHHDPGVRAFAPIIRYVNENLSPESRVLMLFEARGYPFEPKVIQDNKITNWPYLAGILPEGSCGEEGVADHILLASAALNYYRLRGLGAEKLQWGRFQGFAERCLEPVYQVPGYLLFKWETTPREPSGEMNR